MRWEDRASPCSCVKKINSRTWHIWKVSKGTGARIPRCGLPCRSEPHLVPEQAALVQPLQEGLPAALLHHAPAPSAIQVVLHAPQSAVRTLFTMQTLHPLTQYRIICQLRHTCRRSARRLAPEHCCHSVVAKYVAVFGAPRAAKASAEEQPQQPHNLHIGILARMRFDTTRLPRCSKALAQCLGARHRSGVNHI